MLQHPAPDQPHYRLMSQSYSVLPPAQDLWELFDYKPLTGELVWKVRKSTKVDIGKPAGTREKSGYLAIQIAGFRYKAHRLIWRWVTGTDPLPMEVDHINQNKNDNRYQNLRLATRNQNRYNISAYKCNKLGVKGVCLNGKASNKYRAQIRIDGKKVHLGTFSSLEEAELAYIKAATVAHGSFYVYSLNGE